MNKKILFYGLLLLCLQTASATEYVTFHNASKYKIEILVGSFNSADTALIKLEPNESSKPEMVNKKDPVSITAILENNKFLNKEIVFDGKSNSWEINVLAFPKTITVSKKMKRN